MFWRYQVSIGRKDLNLSFSWRPGRRGELVYGMGNRCCGVAPLYVPFLDYDHSPLEWVEDEVRHLQGQYPLGNAYVFSTKKGFHVVFLDKFSIGGLLRVLESTTVDKNYLAVPMLYARRIWVLRSSEKAGTPVTFVKTIYGSEHRPAMPLLTSGAHLLYLRDVLGVPPEELPQHKDTDGETEITLAYYHLPTEG